MWQHHKTSMEHSKIIDTFETYHPQSIILHWLQPLFITFHHHYSTGPFSYFHLFHYIINHFVFCETGKIDNLSAVGGKVFGWVCAGPRLLKIKRQRSSTFTLLLISKSYWFDKPRFYKRGKTATSYNSAFAWGTTQLFNIHYQAVF